MQMKCLLRIVQVLSIQSLYVFCPPCHLLPSFPPSRLLRLLLRSALRVLSLTLSVSLPPSVVFRLLLALTSYSPLFRTRLPLLMRVHAVAITARPALAYSRRSAMEVGSAGQYVQFLEGIQQLWHNPQCQQVYHLHITQRNQNAQQPGLCPPAPQPPLPPPFDHPSLSTPPPPPPPVLEHPTAAPGFHMQHWEQNGLSHIPQGYLDHAHHWQWPCMFQPTAHITPHPSHTLPITLAWTFPPAGPHQRGGSQ